MRSQKANNPRLRVVVYGRVLVQGGWFWNVGMGQDGLRLPTSVLRLVLPRQYGGTWIKCGMQKGTWLLKMRDMRV